MPRLTVPNVWEALGRPIQFEIEAVELTAYNTLRRGNTYTAFIKKNGEVMRRVKLIANGKRNHFTVHVLGQPAQRT